MTAIDCPPDQVFSLEEIEKVLNSNISNSAVSISVALFTVGIVNSQASVAVCLSW